MSNSEKILDKILKCDFPLRQVAIFLDESGCKVEDVKEKEEDVKEEAENVKEKVEKTATKQKTQ